MTQVFISYRRSDAAHSAGRIYDRLAATFGETNVFKDVYAIPLGVDFRTHISKAVAECDVVLVIIGKDWLEASDDEGNRRLEDANDFVRIEVESALARGIPVIPVLVDRAELPTAESLPEPMRDLAYRNAIEVLPDPHFPTDLDRLVKGIRQLNASGGAPPGNAVSRLILPLFLGIIVVGLGIVSLVANGRANQKSTESVEPNPQPSETNAIGSSSDPDPTLAEGLDTEVTKSGIKYFIQSLPPAVENDGASVIEEALITWSRVSSFGGTRVLDEREATLVIATGPTPFVNVIRPRSPKEKWRVIFDDQIRESDYLKGAALHAFGRALGLGYSDNSNDVMFDFAEDPSRKPPTELSANDKEEIAQRSSF